MTMNYSQFGKAARLALLSTASVAALGVSNLAYAQVDDEIIVTATRRSQSVQDIPINISALPGSELEAAGISSGQDLLNLLPGVFASDQGGRTGVENNISMRGLNANNPSENNLFQNVTEPPVSVYLNETPLFMNFKLTDMNRVEVLRGPQGTLYGSGSVGGTIRYILNEPEPGVNSGSVSGGVSFSDHSGEMSYNVDGVANFSLGDKAALRVVGGYETLGGVVDMTGLASLSGGVPVSAGGVDGALVTAPRVEDVDDQKSFYGRASLLFELSDSADVLLTAMHQEGEYDADSVRGISNVADSSGPEYENSMRAIAPGELEADLLSMEVNVDLGFASFTSATGYTKTSGEFVNDVSGLYDTLNASYFYYGFPREVAPSLIDQQADVFTQEVRLVSQGDSKLDWIVGGFYKKEDKDVSFRDTLPGFEEWIGDPTSLGSSFVQPYYATALDFVNQAYYGGAGLPTDTVNVPYAQDRAIEFEDVALFGELTYHLTEAWQVTGGVRLFWQDFSQDNRLRFRYFGADNTVSNSEDFSGELFKFNTSYDVNDDTLVYFTYSEGFRHGGANAFPTTGPFAGDPNLIQIRPDEVTNYEAGIKGRLGANTDYTVSAFLMDWEDVQLDTFLGPLAVPSVINGEEAQSKGIEVSVNTDLSDNFSVDLGYAFVDAALSEDADLDGDGTDDAFDGDALAGVSKHTFSVMADYIMPAGNLGDVRWHGDLAYRSDFQTTFNSNVGNFAELDGFVILNTSVTLERDNYSIGAFIRNLTDEEGVTGVVNNRNATSPFDNRAFVRRPRTYGIQGTIRFD